MIALLSTLHLLVCFSLVVVVLLQAGKGGGLAGAFGGGGTTLFGGRGAGNFLTKATMVLGALFFATSLSLALLSTQRGPGLGRSLIQEEARRAPPPSEAPGTATPRPAVPSGPGPSTPPSTTPQPPPGGTP